MRKRKKFLQILGVVVLLLLAGGALWRWQTAPPRKPDVIPLGDYSYTINYAQYRIDRLMKRYHLPSTAVSLIDDQTIIWQETVGLANIEQEIPATPDTVYKQWSVAKLFTAVEMMRLVEEGRIDLDAPITDYLPEFAIQSRFPESDPITVRSILAHHAGLPRNGCHAIASPPGAYDALGELAASLPDCSAVAPVGYRYKYANIGADTLGHLIQEMRGQPFAPYMQQNLLAPIGMANSVFLSSGIPAHSEVAMGYEYYEGEYYPYPQTDIAELPRGNLYASLTDMSAFVQFIFRDGEAGGEQIIQPATLSQMFEPQYPEQHYPQPMGLGWKTARVLGNELLVWHDGGPTEGIGALVALLPERKLGVVLIANEVSFEGNVAVFLALDILELMLETKYGITLPAAEPSEPTAVDPAMLADYSGRYVVFGEMMDVSLAGDQLEGRVMGMTFALVPISESSFRPNHWLLSLGLAEFLPFPIDPRELEVLFMTGDETDETAMIINFKDVYYEICPKYPEVTAVPALWNEITGTYNLVYRLPLGRIDDEIVGQTEIFIEDGVLKMAGYVGPILPISETELIILSGSFVGETMVYEPESGSITHQMIVYQPTEP